MKKLTAFLLVLVLIFSLCACGGNAVTSSGNETSSAAGSSSAESDTSSAASSVPKISSPSISVDYNTKSSKESTTSKTPPAVKQVTLKEIKTKMINSKDYMITFIGDSITFGFQASSKETSFVGLVAKGIAEKLPDRTVIRYDGIENGLRQPLKGYSEPVSVQEGANGKITVVRSGVSGSRMGETLARMDTDFMGTANGRLPKKADLFIIHLGVNDAGDLSTYKRNMRTLVEKMMANQPETDIILMTPTSTGEGKSQGSPLDDYADAMKALAAEKGLAVIDVHEEWMKHYTPGGPGYGMGNLVADMWHPADPGYKLIADKILSDLFG